MRRPDLPMSLLVLAARQGGLVSTAQCDGEGIGRDRRHTLVTQGRATAPTRNVLDLGAALGAVGMGRRGPDEARRRAACLALLAHGSRAIAVGQCALALLGVEGLPRTIRPEVMLPGGSRRAARDGIVVRRFDGVKPPTVRRGDFLVATPTWALAHAVCELDRGHAVAVLDSALQRHLIRSADLPAVARLAAGRHGCARTSSWWALVDGRAGSPLETRARLQCVDGGSAPDDLQVAIRDARGHVVARGDLGWRLRRGRWLLVEIDGVGPHGTPAALYSDRVRQNAVVTTGMADVLRMTAADLDRTGLLAAAVAAHRAHDELTHRLGAPDPRAAPE